ncbi:MAG: TetR/AcrR family transcriptional regulator [Bacteroidia bacterium]|jgi:AcrR family transcriptional regulator|nr:TetR/AcrR family transcriptional regulator [Bacteroidia bacterium]
MSEVKDKILVEAETLFMRYGFKSITMDDVSRELGISKKTLYQFFADKNDLVNQCVDHHLDSMQNICNHIMNNKENDAIDMMILIADSMKDIMRQMNPSSMFDLKKYFKPAWDKLEEERKGFIRNSVKQNLELGIKKGIYRKDLDIDVISRIYSFLIGYIINPDYYDTAEMDMRSLQVEIIKYHLRSICSPKGYELLEEKIKGFKK